MIVLAQVAAEKAVCAAIISAGSKRQGLDIQISYAIDSCPLGRLLVAQTARGVCAIYFGEADSPSGTRPSRRVSAGAD